MYVERTNYYARPGRVKGVFCIRQRASEIRTRIGLPAGAIYVKAGPDGEGPDVIWECHFHTVEEREADLTARAASPKFTAIREQMSSAVDRFERHFQRRGVPANAAHWAQDVNLDSVPIVPIEMTFQSGEYVLAGFLFLPPGDGPFPCMVFNHGSGIHKGSTDLCKPSLAATLMSWGIAALMPHRRGYGNSSGPSWRDEVTGEFGTDEYDTQLVARLDGESDDVVAALDYVQGLPEIQADHVGVMGSSFGGINTLLAASKSDQFRCAVEFAGAAMNWEHTPALRQHMISVAHQLSQPIFFIQAENDYSTGPTEELSAALENAGQVVQAKIYRGFGVSNMEGHLFERNGTMIWGPEVRRFLERWL
jgi:dienelactone hydrolase